MSSTLKKLNDEVESLALKAEMEDSGDMGRPSQRKAFAKEGLRKTAFPENDRLS